MVTPRTPLTLGLLGLALLGAVGTPARARDDAAVDDPTREVRSALGRGGFPWYDAREDRVRPPRRPWRLGWSFDLPGLGNVLAVVGFLAALGVLVAGLVWLWRMYEPRVPEEARPKSSRGAPSRVESLPEAMRREFESLDPWREAIRRRDRGEWIGSVVCLFAHQLLTLSNLGLLRLGPGRTGRQLVRSVADGEFRALVEPTLRLFESAYYGQKAPAPEEFAAIWANAEVFERRVASGVTA